MICAGAAAGQTGSRRPQRVAAGSLPIAVAEPVALGYTIVYASLLVLGRLAELGPATPVIDAARRRAFPASTTRTPRLRGGVGGG